jgi:hypothetical protein
MFGPRKIWQPWSRATCNAWSKSGLSSEYKTIAFFLVFVFFFLSSFFHQLVLRTNCLFQRISRIERISHYMMTWRHGLVVSSSPAIEETGAMGREIESRHGIYKVFIKE